MYSSSFARDDEDKRELLELLEQMSAQPPTPSPPFVNPMAVKAASPPPSIEQEVGKMYIHCCFKEKEAAKALGANWDPDAKMWYAPNDEAYGKMKKWHPPSTPKTVAYNVPPPMARLRSPVAVPAQPTPPPVVRMSGLGRVPVHFRPRFEPYSSLSRGERMVSMVRSTSG